MAEDFESRRQKLVGTIKKLSYREGGFVLASGKTSNFYIDLKATTLHPLGAKLLGELMVEKLLAEKIQVDGVGGLTLGADPIATAVSLAAFEKQKIWPAYIVRKEAKEHGTAKYLEGSENLKPGGCLVVLEDVMTTGGSSIKAIERVQAAGYKVCAVFTVVDREEGAKESIGKLGIPVYHLATLKETQAWNGQV